MTSQLFVAGLVVLFGILSQINAEDSGLTTKNQDFTFFQECKIQSNQLKFDVLPGRGWDNLRNAEMGQIFALNFSRCSYSQDNKYLLPNQFSLVPLKESAVQLYSQLIEHFSNSTSTTSHSINTGASFGYGPFKASGSFSSEKERIKSFIMQTKSKISKVDLRYRVFKVIAEPDAQLHSIFKGRILDIAAVLTENNDLLYPQYLADLLVRDYGTHVIRTQDVGAALSKIDALSAEYIKKYEKDSNTISVSASASFSSFFSASGSYKSKATQTQIDEYNKNSVKTQVDTYGGSLFRANFTLNDWEQTVLDNLVTIDRNGDPLYYVLTTAALPELNAKMIKRIYNLVEYAVKRYYINNIVAGCTNINDPNFNPAANIDNGECDSPLVNFTLGGVYQTCSGPGDQCGSVKQVNPLTGTYSCPSGFISVKIEEAQNTCKTHCHGAWFWKHCNTDCSNYATYWCYPYRVGPNQNGYQFGGFITKDMPNCPRGFMSLKVGLTSKICVTNDNEPNPDAIPFGGLYSCKTGNPLAATKVTKKLQSSIRSPITTLKYWPKLCSKGYVAHILTLERGCQISYCSKVIVNSYGAFPPIKRPPFIDFNFTPNSTVPLLFQTFDGKKFFRDDSGIWTQSDSSSSKQSAIVGSVLGSLFVAFTLSAVVLMIQRRYYRKKLILHSDTSEFIHEDGNGSYGAINDNTGASQV